MKTERNKQGQEMEAMCDSRSKKYMIKISFIKLRIQDFTKITIVNCKITLSMPNSDSTLDFDHET